MDWRRGYLSSPGSCCSHDPDGFEDKLEGGGIAEMDEGEGRGEGERTLPEELCERYCGGCVDSAVGPVRCPG